MIGQELSGRYRILERLGAGAMGEVYLAEHIQLGRREAIKILQPHVAESPELVARFRREARTINRLHHPNIVSVYDFGKLADGRFYLSMEYVVGDSLGAVIGRQGRLLVPRALPILTQLAEAMHHAHEVGVIHRDLKPDNVMLSQHRGQLDVVKVLDFGLAKILEPEAGESISSTEQGSAYGTPAYMAPEQFLGGEHDARTDVYAFGCIAVELLTGAPPFTGRPMAVMDAHVSRPPPRPSELRPEAQIPPELDALILGCLEKEPARRPSTRVQIADRLRAMPGFPDKSSSGRRSIRRLNVEKAKFDEAITNVAADPWSDHGPVTAELALDGAQTLRFGYGDSLREAADRLYDAGVDTVELVVALADVDSSIADITASGAEVAELERHGAHIEQEAREREASLRFSLGELRFQAGGDDAVQRRIAGLEDAIRATLERRDQQLHEITDREILLVAAISNREAELDAALRALHQAVVTVAARQPDAAVTESLAEADRLVRALRVAGSR